MNVAMSKRATEIAMMKLGKAEAEPDGDESGGCGCDKCQCPKCKAKRAAGKAAPHDGKISDDPNDDMA